MLHQPQPTDSPEDEMDTALANLIRLGLVEQVAPGKYRFAGGQAIEDGRLVEVRKGLWMAPPKSTPEPEPAMADGE